MKKTLIFFVALPLLFAGIGFGTGQYLLAKTTANDSAQTSADGEAAGGGAHTPPLEAPDLEIARIGRIMVPVYKPDSIAYVIADLALAVEGIEMVEFFESMIGATRVRNLILETLTSAAQTSLLSGETVNPDLAADVIEKALHDEFPEVREVRFLSLTTNNRPRSGI